MSGSLLWGRKSFGPRWEEWRKLRDFLCFVVVQQQKWIFEERQNALVWWWCAEYHESCSIIEISPALAFQRPHRSRRQAVSHHQTFPSTQLIMVSQMFKCVTNTQQIKIHKHEEDRKLGFRLYIDTQIQTHKVHKNLFNCNNRINVKYLTGKWPSSSSLQNQTNAAFSLSNDAKNLILSVYFPFVIGPRSPVE